MQKSSIILSILIILTVFLYALSLISVGNVCTWVRNFICQKQDQQKQIQSGITQQDQGTQPQTQQQSDQTPVDSASTAYASLKKVGDSFIHLCDPTIVEAANSYILDYSKCNLSVMIGKDQKTVQKVSVNNGILSQGKIDENLARFWFSF